MEIKKIINIIEDFAPLELQESWDCSGWIIEENQVEVKKVLLAITVDESIVNQAIENDCELIISHHPLFEVPLSLKKGVSIYCAHTNLDATQGGTTDTLIELLNLEKPTSQGKFLRLIKLEKPVNVNDFAQMLKNKLKLQTLKVSNKFNKKELKTLAFCAGSGGDFAHEAAKLGADILITADIKYHCAVDSDIILMDAGHFETEHPVLDTLKKVLEQSIEVMIADEKSPFTYI